MPAPVNVKIGSPSVPIPNWQTEADQWIRLNRQVGGNEGFFPLTVKAVYVIGIIHDLCTSVTHLLRVHDTRQTTYVPAYGIFASSVDILGRCIRGNRSPTKGSTDDIKAGFKWLASNSYATILDTHVLVSTASHRYQIDELVCFRHFAAHGQATSRLQFTQVDYQLLSKMPPVLANGLQRYWMHLQADEKACNNLAQANVLALRSHPVLKSWILFEKDQFGEYHSVEEIFNRFNWAV
jgi:hypothetical protein